VDLLGFKMASGETDRVSKGKTYQPLKYPYMNNEPRCTWIPLIVTSKEAVQAGIVKGVRSASHSIIQEINSSVINLCRVK